MSDDPNAGKPAVDVFTHSSTGFPGAWTEEEMSSLMNAWQEVLETSRFGKKNYDVAPRILMRLRNVKGFRNIQEDIDKVKEDRKKLREYLRNLKIDIRKQVSTLRTEYKVYQGLRKIGIKTVRAPCVDQLEKIIDHIPRTRKRLDSADVTNHVDGVSEDSDQYRNSVSYEREEVIRNGTPRNLSETIPNPEEVSNQKQRPRSQRRMNLQRMIRIMVAQQQTMLDQLEKLFKTLELSNERMVGLMEYLVSVKKTETPVSLQKSETVFTEVIVEDLVSSSKSETLDVIPKMVVDKADESA